jgi:hypothetical protein
MQHDLIGEPSLNAKVLAVWLDGGLVTCGREESAVLTYDMRNNMMGAMEAKEGLMSRRSIGRVGIVARYGRTSVTGFVRRQNIPSQPLI